LIRFEVHRLEVYGEHVVAQSLAAPSDAAS
jgi:hypothetical protein